MESLGKGYVDRAPIQGSDVEAEGVAFAEVVKRW